LTSPKQGTVRIPQAENWFIILSAKHPAKRPPSIPFLSDSGNVAEFLQNLFCLGPKQEFSHFDNKILSTTETFC
jgi:hypothetical protein